MLLNRSTNNGKGLSWMSYIVIIFILAIIAFGARHTLKDYTYNIFKENVETIVQEYIANNPKVLINSLQKMQEREYEDMMQQAQAKVKSNMDELQGKGHAITPMIGNKNGDVTIVTFLDYRCGHCKSSNIVLKEIVAKDPNVKVIFKELPVLGPQSQKLAQMALAVYLVEPAKYLEFHNAVMDMQNINDTNLEALLRKLGLDPVKVNEVMKDEKVTTELESIMNLAQQLDIRGTPAFVINDTLIPGAVDVSSMQDLIKNAREANAKAGSDEQKN